MSIWISVSLLLYTGYHGLLWSVTSQWFHAWINPKTNMQHIPILIYNIRIPIHTSSLNPSYSGFLYLPEIMYLCQVSIKSEQTVPHFTKLCGLGSVWNQFPSTNNVCARACTRVWQREREKAKYSITVHHLAVNSFLRSSCLLLVARVEPLWWNLRQLIWAVHRAIAKPPIQWSPATWTSQFSSCLIYSLKNQSLSQFTVQSISHTVHPHRRT
jgi:hypothetical protein